MSLPISYHLAVFSFGCICPPTFDNFFLGCYFCLGNRTLVLIDLIGLIWSLVVLQNRFLGLLFGFIGLFFGLIV